MEDQKSVFVGSVISEAIDKALDQIVAVLVKNNGILSESEEREIDAGIHLLKQAKKMSKTMKKAREYQERIDEKKKEDEA